MSASAQWIASADCFDIDAGIFFGELGERLVAQCRRDFLGEQFHALARQVIGHVAELELNQEIADLGFLDQIRRCAESRFPGCRR